MFVSWTYSFILVTFAVDFANFIILGELDGVPKQWEGIYNYRIIIPLLFDKNGINTSLLTFRDTPSLKIRERIISDRKKPSRPVYLRSSLMLSYDSQIIT